MTLSAEDQKRIAEQESAWLDDTFGGLDLSAFPALTELPAESKHGDAFARAYGDTALSRSSSALRNFISDPDAEALERVGTETGNPTLLADVRDQRAERVVMEFKFLNPEYLPTPDNFRAMVATLAFNALPSSEQDGDTDDVADRLMAEGHWTLENLQRVYDALDREGLLDKAAGEPRNLTEREHLRVARLAQAGRTEEAIGEYLRCALDGDEPDLELIQDPRYRALCDDAVWIVWEVVTDDYTPSPTREAFLRRHCGERPITIPLLNAAWVELKRRESGYARSELLGQVQRPAEPEPVTAKQIDALDDESVDRLYHESLRAYATSVRHP